jgi:heme A synthase
MKPTAIIGLILIIALILVSEYLRLAPDPQEVLPWARPLHRLVASTIGLLVLGLVGLSLLRHKNRAVCFILLGLTVFLAWLGIYSADSHDPAIVLGNQLGGLAMLGCFAWLVYKCR